MPHLRFRGVEKDQVKAVSKDLLEKLSTELVCPKNHFTIEHIDTTFILDGEENAGDKVFVEIIWVKRDEEKAQWVANLVTEMMKPYAKEDIIIYFTDIVNPNYYKNGIHL